MEQKLKDFLEQSQTVLITSHISPDPDAISSVLLLGRTIKENYPDKKVRMVMEEQPLSDVGFLEGYNLLEFSPLKQAITETEIDLFIMLDANNFDRVSRSEGDEIRAYIARREGRVKTVVIDHHELDGLDEPDVLINNKRPATAEEVYVLLFERLGLKKPQNYAEAALLGIISDTQRHKFDHPGYRETYRIVADLLDAGASIEKLERRLEKHSVDELETISHLASNMTDSGKGYSYSYISDEFTRNWRNQSKQVAAMKNAVELFVNKFIRNFENNTWGFVIYPDLVASPGWWGVSLRSVSGAKDVAAVARELGGGGHKPAAGAKVKAESVQEVIAKVQTAIEKMS